MAVVAASNLTMILRPVGRGQPDGRHGGLSAGTDEAQLFDGGVAGNDTLARSASRLWRRQTGRIARAAEMASTTWKGVAQNHRSHEPK